MISGVDGQPLPFPEGVAPNLKDPYQVLRYHGARFGIQHPEQQLKIIKTERCSLGMIHHTFQQVHLGVDVFTAVIKVHLQADGTPLSINGDFFRLPKKLSVTPVLTSEEALMIAGSLLEQQFLVQTEEPQLAVVNPGWWGDAPLPRPVLAHHLVVEGP